jgi:serine protease Do
LISIGSIGQLPGQQLQSNTQLSKQIGLETALRPLNDQWKQSIVRVHGPQRQPILGTIVAANGLIVAKLSELHEPVHCESAAGHSQPGRLIATDPQSDLALIKIDADHLNSIVFPTDKNTPAVGDLLISAHPDWKRVRIGILSTSLQGLSIQPARIQNGISIGVSVSSQPESKLILSAGRYLQQLGLRVRSVAPRSTGEAANLLIDDLICSVNSQPISSLQTWSSVINEIRAGQKIQFGVVRRDKFFFATAEVLGDSQRTIHDLWGGGPFSERRFNMSPVMIHDSAILPVDCGGPVFDLKGDFVGINNARALRVATCCVPARHIAQWILAVEPDAILRSGK